MSATFVNAKTGQPQKSVSHGSLWFNTKERPLVIKWKKHGVSQYGKFAYFQVDGDPNEYAFNPKMKGVECSDEEWQKMTALMDAAGDAYVSVTAGLHGDKMYLIMEDENGLPVLPGDRQIAEDDLPMRSTPEKAPERPQEGDGIADLIRDCLGDAMAATEAVKQVHGRYPTEDERAIAITLFIERNRR